MIGGTLTRYFGTRFVSAFLMIFVGVFVLIALVEFIESMRRAAGEVIVSPWLIAEMALFRVPQITERIMAFAVLVGAMSCYLSLSRRLELVVARAGGMSAWQFVGPAVIAAFGIGVLATTVYNPLAATLQERSKTIEFGIHGGGGPRSGLQQTGSGYWLRQRSADGHSIMHAVTSSDQGVRLGGVTIFTYDAAGRYRERIDAKSAVLETGFWRLGDARIYAEDTPPQDVAEYRLPTQLGPEQVRQSFATPETVSFWELPAYIKVAENVGRAAAGYKLQYQLLLARPFVLASMVILAAAVSLRLFRFGGVQKMVLSGIAAGFLLYVLSKITEDLSKAELMNPVAAAWLPAFIGSLTGLVVLLHLEDG
jgi:lipopolysaccharide export system permease protein